MASSDAEKGRFREKQGTELDHEEDAAAAKLWAVYVSEAEKYDKALVETWKSDMEGLLIFAALFSAILTAFIIESYRLLNPDSGDVTVQLLAQISQQIAASANGSTFNVTQSTPFTPAPASLVCNGLWFISLGFSLACALIATLVQQWSREFLHRADMRSAPIIRARIFSYLYYGLKRFQMHTVVEIIPLLLHASLFLFFCGLIAFLIPVNTIMMIIAAVVLFIVASIYSVFTLLPLRFLDCPYRTPLSGAFWRVLEGFKRIRYRRGVTTEAAVASGSAVDSEDIVLESSPSVTDKTMVEAMARTAMENSRQRDYKALVWTMKSLADDVELEPFVEAIPDILWGPRGQRYAYQEHIRALIGNPDVQLLNRIGNLLNSRHAGILSPAASQRRAIASYKAFWAVASLSIPDQPSNQLNSAHALDFATYIRSMFRDSANPDVPFYFNFHAMLYANSDTAPYLISAWAMMQWSTFLALKGHLITLRECLVTYEGNSNIKEGSSELEQVAASLIRIRGKFAMLRIQEPIRSPGSTPQQLRSLIEDYLVETPQHIALEFLSQAARLKSAPYRWDETRFTLRISGAVPASVHGWVEFEISDIISTQTDQLLNSAEDVTKPGWFDTCLSELVSLWSPIDTSRIPRAIIVFLNRRKSEFGLKRVLLADKSTEIRLWNCFPRTLSEGASDPLIVAYQYPPPPLPREDSFTALWRLASLRLDYHFFDSDNLQLVSIESLLEALSTTESRFAHISHSIIALLKFQILETLKSGSYRTLEEARLNHCVFPTETAIDILDTDEVLDEIEPSDEPWAFYNFKHNRISEASIYVVAEYLEHCNSDILPYNTAKTLEKVTYCPPSSAIHHTHQLRLANSVHAVFRAAPSAELLNAILNCSCWSLYAQGPKTEDQIRAHRAKVVSGPVLPLWPWLDHPIARQKIEHTFAEYKKQLMSSVDSVEFATVTRLQNILQGLKSWHAERDQ